MKKEIKPLGINIILQPYKENPYTQKESEGGMLLSDGRFSNSDSGEQDILDTIIGCAKVIEIGPKCQDVQIGDDVFYDTRTVRPLPFKRMGFVAVSEAGIISLMNDNLEERFNKKLKKFKKFKQWIKNILFREM
jgi:co-chaperonin GroES (HSP10)